MGAGGRVGGRSIENAALTFMFLKIMIPYSRLRIDQKDIEHFLTLSDLSKLRIRKTSSYFVNDVA